MKLLFCIILLAGCSSLNFSGSERVPVYLGVAPGHDTFMRVEGTIPLYLWGIVTPPEPVSIAKEFEKNGAISISKLSVSEDSSMDLWLARLVTFGMYWPVKWRAEGFVKKSKAQGFIE